MALTYEDCIGLMPELEGQALDIRRLKGGLTNTLYRVKAAGAGDYVFRFYGHKTELFIDRQVEMENLRRLEPLGITPRVTRFLPERGVTVVDFIPGCVLESPDFLKEELWERIVAPIRRIHRSGIILPSRFDPLEEVKRLHRILEGFPPLDPRFDIPGTLRILEKLGERAELASAEYVPCHNDLLADNFILLEDTGRFGAPMCLIDWEYGAMAPAWYDLADMFQEVLVPREVERRLLAVYGETDRMGRLEFLIDLFRPFPDVYWFLWSLIQRNVSAIEFDYDQYGRQKYARALESIACLRKEHGIAI